MTRILVCDDSREDLDLISSIIENFYNGALDNSIAATYSLSRFSNPMDAFSFVEDDNTVDVAILDIMMPGINGMELASGLRKMGFEGHLIFLTTFNDFAEQSYSVRAFSYLVKPAKQEKIFELLRTIEHTRRMTDRNGFPLARKNGTRLVLFSELMYIEVIDHQLYFHLIDGDVLNIYATLRDYSETLLCEKQMLKPQKSFIINLDYVRSFESSALFMRDGARISIPKELPHYTTFYWMTGSWRQINEVRPEWQGEIITFMNIELPAYEFCDTMFIGATGQLSSAINSFIGRVRKPVGVFKNGMHDAIAESSLADNFNYSLAGVPSLHTGFFGDEEAGVFKYYIDVYHSDKDTKELYNEAVMRYSLEFYGALLMSFDQKPFLELDFAKPAEEFMDSLDETALVSDYACYTPPRMIAGSGGGSEV